MKNTIPVHILFIVENNSAPSDIRVWRETKTAKQAGYAVSVISPKNKKYPRSHEVMEGIEIYRHPAYKSKKGKFNQVVEYVNAIFWEFIFCIRVIIKKRFDIVHGANPPDHLFILGIIFKIFGVKYIFDHHDLAPELYAYKFGGEKNLIFRILRLMEKLSCKTSNAIISTNESYKRHIIETHGVNPEKVCVVRNDPEVPVTRKKLNPDPSQAAELTKLIYVGSINIQDGVDLLIKVVHVLVKELGQKQIVCTVVGDGDHLTYVKQLCNELDMAPYFDFKGYVYERETVQQYIDEADICLETAPNSEVNRKSTFIKIMEYMAAGKPIVAFDLDETRFTVKDSAILIEPGNITLFAKAIETLINDIPSRERIGQRSQNRIIEKLNWEEASRKLLYLYKSVL
jgi:glycosyltransferase involved in cell wall biosynthesis